MRVSIVVMIGGLWPLAANATPWQSSQEIDGVRVETRDVPGSSFDELRLTAASRHPTARLCEAVWGRGARLEPGFKLRRLLRETSDERWTYEQIATSIVRDRDFTMHQRRSFERDTCRVWFETQNDQGPPPNKDFVRIPVIRGSWTLAPLASGGSHVTYVIFSEPGGGVPAFLARGAQKKAAVTWMKQVLARASRH